MSKLRLAFALFAGLLAGERAIAQSPCTNPSLTVLPTLPSPLSSFDLRINAATGVVPKVLETSLTLIGSVIEIRASIELGTIDFLGSYEILSTVASMPAGIHDVRYYTRTKGPNTPLGEYSLDCVWQIAVTEPSDRVLAVEYVNAPRNHYFLTSDSDEIAALDGHVFAGWERTGETVGVLKPGTFSQVTFPVCRFYGLPSANLDTHFYSGTASECELLAQQQQSWVLERTDAFRVGQIRFSDGRCPVNMKRVFRLWNGSPAVNHRYTVDAGTQQQMQAQGWVPEGSGMPPAVWCALP